MFQSIEPKALDLNVFSAIGDQWMLITAGTAERCNTMTASWGGLGVLWGAPVATCYIRQSRYTKEFVDGSLAVGVLELANATASAITATAPLAANS